MGTGFIGFATLLLEEVTFIEESRVSRVRRLGTFLIVRCTAVICNYTG